MQNLIIILIVAVIVCLTSLYVIKAKKSGKKCIGCPDGCSCTNSTCNCGQSKK